MSKTFEFNNPSNLTSLFGMTTTNDNQYKEEAEKRRLLLLSEALALGTACSTKDLLAKTEFIGLRQQCKIAFSKARRNFFTTSKKNFTKTVILQIPNCYYKISKSSKPYIVIPNETTRSNKLIQCLDEWATTTFASLLQSVLGGHFLKKMEIEYYGIVSAEDGSTLVFTENDPSHYEAPTPTLFCDSFSYQFNMKPGENEYGCRVSFHVRLAGFVHVPPALETTPSV